MLRTQRLDCLAPHQNCGPLGDVNVYPPRGLLPESRMLLESVSVSAELGTVPSVPLPPLVPNVIVSVWVVPL